MRCKSLAGKGKAGDCLMPGKVRVKESDIPQGPEAAARAVAARARTLRHMEQLLRQAVYNTRIT